MLNIAKRLLAGLLVGVITYIGVVWNLYVVRLYDNYVLRTDNIIGQNDYIYVLLMWGPALAILATIVTVIVVKTPSKKLLIRLPVGIIALIILFCLLLAVESMLLAPGVITVPVQVEPPQAD